MGCGPSYKPTKVQPLTLSKHLNVQSEQTAEHTQQQQNLSSTKHSKHSDFNFTEVKQKQETGMAKNNVERNKSISKQDISIPSVLNVQKIQPSDQIEYQKTTSDRNSANIPNSAKSEEKERINLIKLKQQMILQNSLSKWGSRI